MNSRRVSAVGTAIAIIAGAVCSAVSARQSDAPRSSDAAARPLMLDSDEGELRTRRLHTDSSSPASSQFILKVSPKNNGSQHLVAGTEVLAPGATLPKHRHLVQDEILLIEGGTAQALGFALMEHVVMRDGAMANAQLTNYTIPTALDTPPIDVVLIENPYPGGPFGAKGLGELPMDGPAPAIVNAIRSLGFDVRQVPALPEVLLRESGIGNRESGRRDSPPPAGSTGAKPA